MSEEEENLKAAVTINTRIHVQTSSDFIAFEFIVVYQVDAC